MGTESHDIVDLIIADHQDLKRMIRVLKDPNLEAYERRECFEEFGPMLMSHARPEEEVLYVTMKDTDELREKGFQGETEHELAEMLLSEIHATDDEEAWTARVNVLAELVDHHIKEEEREVLLRVRAHTTTGQRLELGEKFLQAKLHFRAAQRSGYADRYNAVHH